MTNIIVGKSSGVGVKAKRYILRSVTHRKSHWVVPCPLKGSLRGGVGTQQHTQGSRVVLVEFLFMMNPAGILPCCTQELGSPLFAGGIWHHRASPACHSPLGSSEVRQGGVVAIPNGPRSRSDGAGVQQDADGAASFRSRRSDELWDEKLDELYVAAIKASKNFGVM